MDKNKILDILNKSQVIDDIEELPYKNDFLVLRFFYDYDTDELDAAKDYANSQSKEDDSEEKWFDEFYIPYLIDIAVDEVGDAMEEFVESSEYNTEYISYEPDRDDTACEFIAVFTDKDKDFEIDSILDDLKI